MANGRLNNRCIYIQVNTFCLYVKQILNKEIFSSTLNKLGISQIKQIIQILIYFIIVYDDKKFVNDINITKMGGRRDHLINSFVTLNG